MLITVTIMGLSYKYRYIQMRDWRTVLGDSCGGG